MTIISVGDARDKLTQLLKLVENGEEVTITRHGEPIADLIRTRASTQQAPRFGTLSGRGVVVDPNWHKGPQTDAELESWLEGNFE